MLGLIWPAGIEFDMCDIEDLKSIKKCFPKFLKQSKV